MIANRTSKAFVTSFILIASAAAACRVQTGGGAYGPGGGPPPGGSGGGDAYGGAGVTAVEVIEDESGKTYRVQQGVKGDPKVVGCADGQREAFVDGQTFATIAGCVASWPGALSLRAPRSGGACGDDAGACASPADACAPGWHVCAADGVVADVKQVTADQCAHAGGGRFSAGISHCTEQVDCKYDHSPQASYPCFATGWCSEPVCCGDDCGDFGACTGGVWENATHIPVGTDQGCGASTSQRAGGILCCKG